MAVQFPLSTASLTRSSTYLNRAADWTRFLWIRNGTTVPPTTFRNYISDGDTSFTNPYVYIGSGTAVKTVVVEVFDGITTQDTVDVTMVDGTWYWVAAVYDSVGHTIKFYVSGTLVGTLSVNLTAVVFTVQTQVAGGADADDADAYIREWQSALTLPQLVLEAAATLAVETTNLLTDTNLNSPGGAGYLDHSGNGHNWTGNGSPTAIQGPIITSQYGGVVGLTSNFSQGTTGLTELIAVGNALNYASSSSAFRGFQVWIDTTGKTFGDGINNPVVVGIYLRYSTPNPAQTANFDVISMGNVSLGIFYGAPMQTVELAFALSSLGADGVPGDDGWADLYVDGSLIASVSGLRTHAQFAALPSWTAVRVNCLGFVPSIYLFERTTLCVGYGQSSSTPAPVAGGPTTVPATVSNVCVDGQAFPVIWNQNFTGLVDADVFFQDGGFWHKIYGNLVDGTVPPADLDLIGGFLWGIAGASIGAGVYNESLTPSSLLTSPPPAGSGTLIVTKVTQPSADPQLFDFIAGGGLSPSSFSLTDGGIQTYSTVVPGSGYSIEETPVSGWITNITVSNGSLASNISVADGEIVTVTVTNVHSSATSGIYQIVPNKTNDTIYIDNAGNTLVVKIPDPFAISAELEGEE